MKVCFIGMGSIGKRHLKNLTLICEEYKINLEIHAFRNTKKSLSDEIKTLIHKEIFSEVDLCDDYDIAFITNPTNLHYNTIQLMANKSENMFIEKPVFDSNKYDIYNLKLKEPGVYYVASPLKFSNVIKFLKGIITNENVYSVRVICSSYLPNWRKGIDYRNSYSAKKSEGGGVSIDLIHEWGYITYLFGFPTEIFNLRGKVSNLEIDSEDLSIYIAKYHDKLVELHLDYFGMESKRKIQILTNKGTIIGDFINHTISFTDGRKTIYFSEENNDMYIEEMKSFIDEIIYSTKGYNNITNAYKLLNIAKGRL